MTFFNFLASRNDRFLYVQWCKECDLGRALQIIVRKTLREPRFSNVAAEFSGRDKGHCGSAFRGSGQGALC